jgi:predicted acylesterase/phospholipase RssA
MLVGLLALVSAAPSCGTLSDPEPYTPNDAEHARIPGFPDDIRFWADSPATIVLREAKERAEAERKAGLYRNGRPPPSHVLALSGGGEDGAFGAGLLVGWTEHGSRPTFDIVTGVSTGALIAPLAFIGPSRDEELKVAYTTIDKRAIFVRRGLLALFGGESLATNDPLREMVSRFVTAELLAAIRQEYARGRRLYVITTNLDSQRPVLWDMGRIASSDHPRSLALFREVLVASASVPGVLPPVYLNVEANGWQFQEMHVDGGVTAQVFSIPVAGALAATSDGAGAGRQRTIYVVVNNRMEPQFKQAKRGLLTISGRSVSTLIKVHGAGGVRDIYHLARHVKAEFRLAYIDRDFIDVAPEPFDKAYMNRLFQYGYEIGRRGYPWKRVPPGVDEDWPRPETLPAHRARRS